MFLSVESIFCCFVFARCCHPAGWLVGALHATQSCDITLSQPAKDGRNNGGVVGRVFIVPIHLRWGEGKKNPGRRE